MSGENSRCKVRKPFGNPPYPGVAKPKHSLRNCPVPVGLAGGQKKNHPPKGRWLQISYLIPLLK